MYARIQFRLIMLLVSLLLSHHLNVIIIIIMFENIPYLEINRKKEKKINIIILLIIQELLHWYKGVLLNIQYKYRNEI